MAPVLTGVAPSIFSTTGGDSLVIDGTFDLNADLEVKVGGVVAYGGAGRGYFPRSADGTTVAVAVPPLPGGVVDVGVRLVSAGPETVLASAVTIVERNFGSSTHRVRRHLVRWMELGARSTELEPEQ